MVGQHGVLMLIGWMVSPQMSIVQTVNIKMSGLDSACMACLTAYGKLSNG